MEKIYHDYLEELRLSIKIGIMYLKDDIYKVACIVYENVRKCVDPRCVDYPKLVAMAIVCDAFIYCRRWMLISKYTGRKLINYQKLLFDCAIYSLSMRDAGEYVMDEETTNELIVIADTIGSIPMLKHSIDDVAIMTVSAKSIKDESMATKYVDHYFDNCVKEALTIPII